MCISSLNFPLHSRLVFICLLNIWTWMHSRHLKLNISKKMEPPDIQCLPTSLFAVIHISLIGKSVLTWAMPAFHPNHQHVMSAPPSKNNQNRIASQHLHCSQSSFHHYSPPCWSLHVCLRTLTICSLTAARSDPVKHKIDHVTLLLKPFSGFPSQNKIYSLIMTCNCSPVTSPTCLLPLLSLSPTLFQSHWPLRSYQEQCPASGPWHVLPFSFPVVHVAHCLASFRSLLNYAKYSLNKNNIRAYWLSRAIDDGDSKPRLT